MDISRIERYWAKAQECERLAEQARDPTVKATYRDLAQQWRLMTEVDRVHILLWSDDAGRRLPRVSASVEHSLREE
jgi:hypothetical protein